MPKQDAIQSAKNLESTISSLNTDLDIKSDIRKR